MEFKGTKGKWQTRKNYDSARQQYVIDIDAGDSVKSLATIWSASSKKIDKTTKADALLISKAPEMLEMLHHVLALSQCGNIVEAYKVEELIKSATEL